MSKESERHTNKILVKNIFGKLVAYFYTKGSVSLLAGKVLKNLSQ